MADELRIAPDAGGTFVSSEQVREGAKCEERRMSKCLLVCSRKPTFDLSIHEYRTKCRARSKPDGVLTRRSTVLRMNGMLGRPQPTTTGEEEIMPSDLCRGRWLAASA